MLGDRIGQRLALGKPAEHAGAVSSVKAARGQHRHVRLADPGWLELGPERNDHQHRQLGNMGYRSIEQVERCRVDPMRVLTNNQHRTLRR